MGRKTMEVLTCENCKWRSDDFTSVCVNDQSDRLGDFVYSGDTCGYWAPAVKEPKACPFCGGKAAVTGKKDRYWVTCACCGAAVIFPGCDDEEEAVRAWNGRSTAN